MSALQLVLEGDPILTKPSTPVVDFDDDLRTLVRRMRAVQKAERGMGLAAVQVGVPLRLFTWSDEHGEHAICNPRIYYYSGEVESDEACLSIPGKVWTIARHRHVTIIGQDIRGWGVEYEASDLLARCFQHEIDHLNGVLISSRA